MKGVYTDIINSVYNRILAGKTALGIQTIQIVHRQERLQQNDMPYVLISPDEPFISEEYGRAVQNRKKDATVNLSIYTNYPISDRDGANMLYVAGDTPTGFLPYIEQLLDYINTDGSTLNPQIQDSALSIAVSVGEFVKNDRSVECVISLAITTKSFTINNRNEN